jgi:(p)ppGpp synthase/HD superfamily hydrolase
MAVTVNMTAASRAKSDAVKAHESIAQTRKHGKSAYGRVRYYFHPLMVAELVGAVTEDEDIIAAAALHDVLEDVSPHNNVFSASWMERAYGTRVLELVVECTNVFSKDETQRNILLEAHSVLRGITRYKSSVAVSDAQLHTWFSMADLANRGERKRMEAERYANISEAAKIIKRADLYHNASEVDPNDKFWATWLKEKALIDSFIGRWEDMPKLADAVLV